MKTSLFALILLVVSSMTAVAQDTHAGHGAATGTVAAKLPEICTVPPAGGNELMAMDHEMDEAHSALMARMEETNKQMMDAMMIDDIDVAFICGMIPHHQAAINMARAELEHGDNDWAKEMAQKIIDTQETEIAEMVTWLEGEGASE